MTTLAPIVFFAYNRPYHTRQTLEAISKSHLSDQSAIYIYIDGPKENAPETTIANINEVKKIAAEKMWCKEVSIIIAEKNNGLFKSITNGITTAMAQFGKAIIIEDDVLVAPGFLTFMNDALNLYEDTSEVMHISGFSRTDFNNANLKESTYFFNHTTCWGWATWKRAWDKFNPNAIEVKKLVGKKGSISKLNMNSTFEFFWGLKAIADGKFQSWNTIWHSVVFLNDGFCLHPAISQVSNIGHDGSGTNCAADTDFGKNELNNRPVIVTKIPLQNDQTIQNLYSALFSFKYRVIFTLKHYLKYLISI